MYTLREYLCAEVGLPRRKVPSDKFFCAEIGTKEATRINHMHRTLACYAYTLVSQGWIRVKDNGQEHELRRGDLFIYVAGNQESVTGCSADFHAISLIADEIATIETHAIHRITSASPYSSFVHLRQTALHLSTNAARLLWRRMKEMADYIQAGHRNLDDYLSAFYSLFLLDLENEAFRIITPPQ